MMCSPWQRGICFELPPRLCRRDGKWESCSSIASLALSPRLPKPFPSSLAPATPTPAAPPPATYQPRTEPPAAPGPGPLALGLAQPLGGRGSAAGSSSLPPLPSAGMRPRLRGWAGALPGGGGDSGGGGSGRGEPPRAQSVAPGPCPAFGAAQAAAELPGQEQRWLFPAGAGGRTLVPVCVLTDN